MIWRPKDWNNPYLDKGLCWERRCFEQGADAILEYLLERGRTWEGEDADFLVKLIKNVHISLLPSAVR